MCGDKNIENSFIDPQFKAPDHKVIYFFEKVNFPEKITPDFELDCNEELNEEEFTSCNFNSSQGCLFLYTIEDSSRMSTSWKLKASRSTPSPIGVTYGQRVGYGEIFTRSTVINPGEIIDLGLKRFGYGSQRAVWLISSWFN
ncbi:hypothetical protein ACM9HF_03520 [Colwellia sp. RE-S-Sl-9]